MGEVTTTAEIDYEKKAREISVISGEAALADDSGICADALDGRPGIYSARFAGEHGNDLANNKLLVDSLRDKDSKRAHYTCAMALVYPDGSLVTAEGYLHGEIVEEPRGDRGFGYDPHFVPLGEKRPVAEMTDEEKNAISHRGAALRELLGKIK
jgi:XTP/dITP diphosphohydrolase